MQGDDCAAKVWYNDVAASIEIWGKFGVAWSTSCDFWSVNKSHSGPDRKYANMAKRPSKNFHLSMWMCTENTVHVVKKDLQFRWRVVVLQQLACFDCVID